MITIFFVILSLHTLKLADPLTRNLVQNHNSGIVDIDNSRPELKGEKVYSHDNKKLGDVVECTNVQLQSISNQLGLDGKVVIGGLTNCPNPTWIADFYKEEKDIEEFLGVSIGCNKGHDAIRTARMGMSNAEFDVNEWIKAVGIRTGFVCGIGDAEHQPEIVFPNRVGEMHW
jgi:hypothetical protein